MIAVAPLFSVSSARHSTISYMPLCRLPDLKDVHGAIPNDRLTIQSATLISSLAFRAVVQAQPIIRDRVGGHHLKANLLAAQRKFVTAHHVLEQNQLHAFFFDSGLQGLGQLQEIPSRRELSTDKPQAFRKVKTMLPPKTSLSTFSSVDSIIMSMRPSVSSLMLQNRMPWSPAPTFISSLPTCMPPTMSGLSLLMRTKTSGARQTPQRYLPIAAHTRATPP